MTSNIMIRMGRRLGVVAAGIAAIVGISMSPASASSAPTSYGGCVDTGKTYDTYVTSQGQWSQNSKAKDQINFNFWDYGNTYDCGPAGNGQSVSALKLTLVYEVTGSKVDCDLEVTGTVGGDDGGSVSVGTTCASTDTSQTVTETYTCHNIDHCRISDSNATFFANPDGGSLDHLYIWAKATITGSDGVSNSNSSQRIF